MATPLLRTKLHIPPVRPEMVSRPSLLKRLNAGLHRKLTLISAPAGFGKTTLLSEWVTGCGRREPTVRIAWLSLDKSDDDPTRFWAYFVAALQTVRADIGATAVAMLRSPQPPPIEAILTALINEVAAVPDAPAVGSGHRLGLVLDDYHLIEASPIHDAIAFLLDHLPPQMHLVIASRADPPLPLSRLRGRSQLTELRAADLRFTPDEVAAFLNQVMGLALSVEDLAALEVRTEGWIVGLQMAALSMQGRDAERVAGLIAALTGSQRYILDYLTDEVLLQQPEDVQTFLLRTAILDRLSGPLCDAVTGRDDGQEMLGQLDAANLFVVPLDDERRWYRYHHLFAEFLRTELDEGHQSALHLKAACWFAAHDLLPEAVQHALASGDISEAARLIALAADGAFRISSFTTLLGWLNAIPDEAVRTNAELATYKGVVLILTRQYAEAASYADAAERSLPSDAPPPSRGRLLSLKAQVALCNDAPDSAIQLSREALALLGDGDAVFRSLTLNVMGQVMQTQGDIAAAADAYRDAVLIERESGNQAGPLQLANLVFALNELGRRGEALAVCQQAVEEGASQPDRASPLAEVIYFVWSLLSYEANELNLAREQALRGLDVCRQMNFTDGVFLSHYVLAQVYLAGGEIDAMLKVTRQVRQYAARLNLALPYEPWLAGLEAQGKGVRCD